MVLSQKKSRNTYFIVDYNWTADILYSYRNAMEKLIRTTDATDLDLNEMSIEEAIEYLQSLQEKYSKDWTDLQIYEDYCYEGGYNLKLRGKRYETDLEYENRSRREKESLERQMTRDHSEYERLKALFEKQ
jgi:hypothetical protein